MLKKTHIMKFKGSTVLSTVPAWRSQIYDSIVRTRMSIAKVHYCLAGLKLLLGPATAAAEVAYTGGGGPAASSE